jgi:two-component system chemotaxis response regulator CheB
MAAAPRIVVADDSPFMRTVLGGALVLPASTWWGHARDGDEALAQCRATQPDAMTSTSPCPASTASGSCAPSRRTAHPTCPVIVVSAFSPAHGARAVDALAEAPFDLVPKPAVGEPFHTFTENLAERLRQAVAPASTAPLVGDRNGGAGNGHAAPPHPAPPCPPPARRARSSSPPPPAARARWPSCCPRSPPARARAP